MHVKERQDKEVQVVIKYYYNLQRKFEEKQCLYVMCEKNYVREKKD